MTDGFFVEITGADLSETEMSRLDTLVKETGAKLATIYDGNEKLHLHVRTYNDDGKRKKYSIKTLFETKVGIFNAKSDDWDLSLCAGQCLDKLERLVIDDHKKRIDKRHKQ